MPYITDAALLSAVAVRLGTTPDILVSGQPGITDIIADANNEAHAQILSVMVGRGYEVSVTDAWDRREEFNRKLGVCIALENGAVTREVDFEAIDRICKCREELLTVLVLVDGEIPETGGTPNVSHGDLSHPDDVFTEDNFRRHGWLSPSWNSESGLGRY